MGYNRITYMQLARMFLSDQIVHEVVVCTPTPVSAREHSHTEAVLNWRNTDTFVGHGPEPKESTD